MITTPAQVQDGRNLLLLLATPLQFAYTANGNLCLYVYLHDTRKHSFNGLMSHVRCLLLTGLVKWCTVAFFAALMPFKHCIYRTCACVWVRLSPLWLAFHCTLMSHVLWRNLLLMHELPDDENEAQSNECHHNTVPALEMSRAGCCGAARFHRWNTSVQTTPCSRKVLFIHRNIKNKT